MGEKKGTRSVRDAKKERDRKRGGQKSMADLSDPGRRVKTPHLLISHSPVDDS